MFASPVWTGIRTRRGKATQTAAIASAASESGSGPRKSDRLEAHASRTEHFVTPTPRQNAPLSTTTRAPRRSSYLDIEQEGKHHKIYLNPSPPSRDSSRKYLKVPGLVRTPLQDITPTPSSHVHWPDSALNKRGALLVVPVAEREKSVPSAPAITSMQVYRDPPLTVRSVLLKPINVPLYIKHDNTVSSQLSRPCPPSRPVSGSRACSRSRSITQDDDATRVDIEPRGRRTSPSRESSRACTPATLSDIDFPLKPQTSSSRCGSACPSDAGRRNGPTCGKCDPSAYFEVTPALEKTVQPIVAQPSRFTTVLRPLLFLLLLIVLATSLFGRHAGSSGLVRPSLHTMQKSSTS